MADHDSFCNPVKEAIFGHLNRCLAETSDISRGALVVRHRERDYPYRGVGAEYEEGDASSGAGTPLSSAPVFYSRITVPCFDRELFRRILTAPAAAAAEFGKLLAEQLAIRVVYDMINVGVSAMNGAFKLVDESFYDARTAVLSFAALQSASQQLAASNDTETIVWVVPRKAFYDLGGGSSSQVQHQLGDVDIVDIKGVQYFVANCPTLSIEDGSAAAVAEHRTLGIVPGGLRVTLYDYYSRVDARADYFRAGWKYGIEVQGFSWAKRFSSSFEPTLEDLNTAGNWKLDPEHGKPAGVVIASR